MSYTWIAHSCAFHRSFGWLLPFGWAHGKVERKLCRTQEKKMSATVNEWKRDRKRERKLHIIEKRNITIKIENFLRVYRNIGCRFVQMCVCVCMCCVGQYTNTRSNVWMNERVSERARRAYLCLCVYFSFHTNQCTTTNFTNTWNGEQKKMIKD